MRYIIKFRERLFDCSTIIYGESVYGYFGYNNAEITERLTKKIKGLKEYKKYMELKGSPFYTDSEVKLKDIRGKNNLDSNKDLNGVDFACIMKCFESETEDPEVVLKFPLRKVRDRLKEKFSYYDNKLKDRDHAGSILRNIIARLEGGTNRDIGFESGKDKSLLANLKEFFAMEEWAIRKKYLKNLSDDKEYLKEELVNEVSTSMKKLNKEFKPYEDQRDELETALNKVNIELSKKK